MSDDLVVGFRRDDDDWDDDDGVEEEDEYVALIRALEPIRDGKPGFMPVYRLVPALALARAVDDPSALDGHPVVPWELLEVLDVYARSVAGGEAVFPHPPTHLPFDQACAGLSPEQVERLRRMMDSGEIETRDTGDTRVISGRSMEKLLALWQE